MAVGFMQGRLSPIVDGLIQRFPIESWSEEFRVAERIRLRCMEWTLDQEGLRKNPLMTDHGRIQILALAKRYGLVIPSVTGDCFMQAPFWKSRDSLVRNSLIEDLRLIVQACGGTGIKLIVVPLVDNGSLESDVQISSLNEGMRKIAPSLKDHGVTIAFESDYEPRKLKRFIDSYPSNNFGINYDIGNSAGMGFDPTEEIQTYRDRILNVHVKDRVLGGVTVPLGEGSADFKTVFDELLKSYKGHYILQTARDPLGLHEDALVRYKAFVESYVGP